MCSPEGLPHSPSRRWRLVTRLWSIGTGVFCTRTTLVGVAALVLGGCATPLTVSTAQTPEPPVERWRGVNHYQGVPAAPGQRERREVHLALTPRRRLEPHHRLDRARKVIHSPLGK